MPEADTLLSAKIKLMRLPLVFGLSAIVLIAAFLAKGCRREDTHERYTPEQWKDRAEEALEAITPENRNDLRGVYFDSVLKPIDMLLAKAKSTLEDIAKESEKKGEFDAAKESLALISAQYAHDLAERGQDLAIATANPKRLRFPDQRAEATVYIATVNWARLRREYAEEFRLNPDFQPPERQMSIILRDIQSSQTAATREQKNLKELAYLEGTIRYHMADFAGSMEAYERATELDPQYGDAYGGLGRACIEMEELDKAEKAFDMQVTVGENESRNPNRKDFTTLLAGLYNAAELHDGLYERYMGSNEPDAPALTEKHRQKAVERYSQLLKTPGAMDDPSFQEVRSRLSYLESQRGNH